MATLVPKFQAYVDLARDGTKISLTKVVLLSTSDAVTISPGAHTTDGLSVKQINDANETTATVTFDSSTGIATIVGVAGNKVTLVGIHRQINTDGN